MSLVLKNEELETKPIFEDEGVSYISIKHNDLICEYFLLLVCNNSHFIMLFSDGGHEEKYRRLDDFALFVHAH